VVGVKEERAHEEAAAANDGRSDHKMALKARVRRKAGWEGWGAKGRGEVMRDRGCVACADVPSQAVVSHVAALRSACASTPFTAKPAIQSRLVRGITHTHVCEGREEGEKKEEGGRGGKEGKVGRERERGKGGLGK
jgi:hypothetical protein